MKVSGSDEHTIFIHEILKDENYTMYYNQGFYCHKFKKSFEININKAN